MSKIKLLLNVVSDLHTLAESIEAVVEAMQGETTETVTEAKPKVVTLEEVRAMLTTKKQQGISITELLNKFGASKLTDINPNDYAMLLHAVEEE